MNESLDFWRGSAAERRRIEAIVKALEARGLEHAAIPWRSIRRSAPRRQWRRSAISLRSTSSVPFHARRRNENEIPSRPQRSAR
jgi:hypothetical protein